MTAWTGPWRVPAVVERVIDGDTFTALIDVGWGIFHRPKRGIRILAADGGPFDAPDRATPQAKAAATGYARTLLPAGTEVLITSYRITTDIDDFGRTLAAVTLPDGRDFAAVMTEAGHIKAAAP